MSSKISRRNFLKEASVGTAGLALSLSTLGNARKPAGDETIQKRPLGATGLDVTILGLGCVALGSGRRSVDEGAEIVEACIDNGITYIDCASTYGNAEVKVGAVMKRRRNEVVLTTKTLERSKEEAWKEINRSLERLQTDHVDLLQIHSVNRMDELDTITGTDGSLAAALRARDEGLCHHIGITGHTRPEVIEEALRRFTFETVLIPLSSTDALISDFGKALFPVAKRQGFGIIAMKVLAAGRVTCCIQESIRYAMSLPVSTAIVGMGRVDEVLENVAVARSFVPMSSRRMADLEEKTKAYATTSVMWWKRR